MHLLPWLFVVLLVPSFGVLLLALRPSAQQRIVEARISDIRNPRRTLRGDPGDAQMEGLLQSGMQARLSERLGAMLEHYSLTARVERLLLEADSSTSVGALALRSLLAGSGSAVAVGVVFHAVWFALVAGAGGLLLPLLLLKFRKSRRLRAATAGLPDTADLMARALRSGHSMTQTIELLAEQPAPLGSEFARVFQQQKLGMPLRDVLVELGDRLPSRDLRFLLTAILVQKETGGDLAVVLDRTALVLRERIQLQAQVQTFTAQGRLTGWILALMPVFLLAAMMLFSASYVRILFTDPLGQRLLLTASALVVTGGLIIRRIVGVQV